MRYFELVLRMIVVVSFFSYIFTFGRVEAAIFMISASMSIGICLGETKVMGRRESGSKQRTRKT